jgi:putative lipase involved disintegration of autophagic bodies
MVADGLQVTGMSAQYSLSAKNARLISDYIGEGDLTFTGHSLGGGLAAVNAYATGRNAITFNAAGVSNPTIMTAVGVGNYHSRAQIDAFIMLTDPLDYLQRKMGLPSANGVRHSVTPRLKGIFNGHSIDNMIKALE